MTYRRTASILAMSLIFPAADPRFFEMYSHFQDPELMLQRLLKTNAPELPPDLMSGIRRFNMDIVNDIIGYCENRGIKILTFLDKEYPECFNRICCPPILIYCMGELSDAMNRPSLAAVGARKASSYSLRAAEYFSSVTAKNGFTIVSGFANGTDTAAHTSAISAGGKTLSVLGYGIDYDYPSGKGKLKKLISQNGAVLSEYPPLEPPAPNNFRVRNRLIAALSDGVLVIQAGNKSGALNTVGHALDQGKDIFVIPPRDIFSSDYAGQAMLLRDGAEAVCSPEEIMLSILGSF